MISMTVGEMMHHLQKISNEEEEAQDAIELTEDKDNEALVKPTAEDLKARLQDSQVTHRNPVFHWIVRILCVVTLVFTVIGLMSNYLQIKMIFFKQNHYSAVTAIKALFSMG